MRPPVYLGWLGATVAVLAVVALALTIAVDPYRMFGTPTVPGWTALKPRATEQLGIAKTYQLERIAPKTLLLGNSRTEIGLDPASGVFSDAQRPVFNAAFAGGDVCTSLAMLRDALAVRSVQAVMLGVDFQDLLTVPAAARAEAPHRSAEERRLLVDPGGNPNPDRAYQIWKDRWASTLTIDAAVDSIMTLLDQNLATSATMTPLGFNPLHEYRVFAARSGYYPLFATKEEAYQKQFANYGKPDFLHPSPIMAQRDACFRELIKNASAHGIVLTLYIHPYHARFLNMLKAVGLWPSFEAWKRNLVAEVGRLEQEPNDIRIFDFSGYNSYTTDPVPPRGDITSKMQWYWEPRHYKSALGEQILMRIFRGDTGFGRMLTAANIESVLSETRDERMSWSAR
jgi:hypothetical protein